MQPEVVARTLKSVEDKWKEEAAAFIHCNATGGDDCQVGQVHALKSCAVVVGAVVQGSNGDARVAKEYMSNICSQSLIKGWHQQHCVALKVALDSAMTADNYENRNTFTAGKLCNKFWAQFVEEEKKRFVTEEAEREAAEKEAIQKAKEEAVKKAKEAAEKEQKAKEELAIQQKKAKEDAEKKASEEAARKKIEDAKRIKAAAQAKAAEASEKLAKVRAEAAELAKQAQLKVEEADEAEREHKKALANVTTLDNTTVSVATKEQEVAPAAKPVVNVAPAMNNSTEAKAAPKDTATVVKSAAPTLKAGAKAAVKK